MFAVVAFADTTSGYLPSGGVSPHGDYDTTTKKCAVCHAVHKAEPGGEALLRSTRADACTYCHISPGVSTKIVYEGVAANYSSSDFTNAHNNAGVTPVMCTSCHQVHAAANAMTGNDYLDAAILTKGVAYDADSDGLLGAPATGTAETFDVALTKWCTKCHTYWPGSIPGVDMDSHVLGAAGTADGSSSFTSSTYCTSCHASNTVGGVVTTGSAFPHYTDGARFLTAAETSAGGTVNATYTTDSQYDGVCLRCHRNGAGSGIGKTM